MFYFLGRKTEEGFLIYKEDELGIGDEGGGTFNDHYHVLSDSLVVAIRYTFVSFRLRLLYVP